ncbi:MAG: tyrosine-type recombinase/integrase [Actinomycetota bacterium]|nr:tyrosine-type recombinase/integrase [Actinomycetota bacterium]
MSNRIRKVARQHYIVTIELKPDPMTGKRRRESHTVHGPRDQAEALCSQLLVDIQRGEYVARSSSTVADVCRTWLNKKSAAMAAKNGQKGSPRTLERYKSLLNGSVIPSLGAWPIQKLTTEHIEAFYAASLEHVSAATVHHRHVALQQALEYAVKSHLIATNPAKDADVPEAEHREMRFLTGEEAATLIAAATGTSLEVPVRLALDTGMRLGEILGLRWSDVSLDAGRLTVNQTVLELSSAGTGLDFKGPKTKAGRRTIALASPTVAFLREHKRAQTAQRLAMGPGWASNDLVICSACGEPVRPSTVSRHFGRLVNPPTPKATRRTPEPEPKSGPLSKPCRFHDLRHTHATLALAAGMPVKVVSQRLGHTKASFTLDVYAHVLPKQDQEAADTVASAIYGTAHAL